MRQADVHVTPHQLTTEAFMERLKVSLLYQGFRKSGHDSLGQPVYEHVPTWKASRFDEERLKWSEAIGDTPREAVLELLKSLDML